jgi:cation diffusion facilitator CzcD-associated flavoprotein CzcO
MSTTETTTTEQLPRGVELPAHADVAIIGSGFSGLAMAVELKQAGREDFVILERGHDVGGTWRDNAYPGCACDVPSHVYSFSFAPNPEWSTTFSPQPEIHAYIQKVARDLGLVEHVRFGCEVEDAKWDSAAQRYEIRTSAGSMTARVLVSAAGPLSEPSIPDIKGLRDFKGTIFHSASWDHEHDLAGERVAVIGTGASAIQFVPKIQPEVGELHLYQRTAPWIMPRTERKITRAERAVYRRFPAAQRAMRTGIFWGRELIALPLLRHRLTPLLRKVGEAHLRKQVPDPELRARLTPDYEPGCKRLLISNTYLPALTQPNVSVLTDGIQEVRENSIVDANGVEREVDTIILGTGFHVTDLPIVQRLRDGDGRTLGEHWADGLSAHRGTTVAGFPNLFFLLGPNTGSGHMSVIFNAESQVSYVMGALEHMERAGAAAVEPRPEAQDAWNDSVQARMDGTVWTAGGCASWYLDANGRNTTLWPDFAFRFRQEVKRFAPAEHELVLAGVPVPVSPPVSVPLSAAVPVSTAPKAEVVA